MEYKITKEYIFSQVAKRIKDKKKQFSLSYYQLAGYENKKKYEFKVPLTSGEEYDIALIKSITNGKFYNKRNPYLIPDAYIERLCSQLGFKDGELLWGDYINSDLSKYLFRMICLDILYSDNLELKNTINDFLIDYVPYAKYLSYWEMFCSHEIEIAKLPYNEYKIPPSFYGIYEDEIINNFKPIQQEAIMFLYEKCHDEFQNIVTSFILVNSHSFKKLDKKIDVLVRTDLLNILKPLKPNEYSLGLRVRNLIISDWRSIGYNLSDEMRGDSLGLNNRKTEKILIESSSVYINDLERIQNLKIMCKLNEYK